MNKIYLYFHFTEIKFVENQLFRSSISLSPPTMSHLKLLPQLPVRPSIILPYNFRLPIIRSLSFGIFNYRKLTLIMALASLKPPLSLNTTFHVAAFYVTGWNVTFPQCLPWFTKAIGPVTHVCKVLRTVWKGIAKRLSPSFFEKDFQRVISPLQSWTVPIGSCSNDYDLFNM